MMSGQSPSMGGMASFLSGAFGNSGAPYQDAMDSYNQYMNKAGGFQQPYMNAGNQAIPQYQQWLQQMQDPQGFINHIMSGYQQSPWAKNMQQASMRAGTNAASASGMTGSTPFTQQMQQNAGQISSQDQNNWLQNVMGANNQYGGGLNSLMQMGQGSANNMSNLYGQAAPWMGEQTYNKGAAKNNDWYNMIGGGMDMFANGLFG